MSCHGLQCEETVIGPKFRQTRKQQAKFSDSFSKKLTVIEGPNGR